MRRYISSLILLAVYAKALSFGTPPQTQPKHPIRRIAVIGSGIAGLSLAHCLADEEFEVKLFDARSSPDKTAGSGLQLNGGLAVLPEKVRDAVARASVQVTDIHGRSNAWFGGETARKLYDLNIQNIVQDIEDEDTAKMLVDSKGKAAWYAILRGTLQKVLIDTLPSSISNEIQFGKKLSGLSQDLDGAMCRFADGTTAGPFDLVVGCDGIRSSVKEFVETGEINSERSVQNSIYSGIRIQYAIRDGEPLDEVGDEVVLRQRFANGAYVLRAIYGTGPDTPPSVGAFCVKLDDDYIGPFRKKESTPKEISENVDWETSDLKQNMMDQMDRFNIAPGSEGDVRSTLEKADRFFELGVYFHNPLSLKGWSRQIPGTANAFAVLCGDSAHAMPPFLGQGANQAMQDARCLADAIKQFNVNDSTSAGQVELSSLLKSYESKRWWPTTSLTIKAVALGYLETGGPDGILSKFRDALFQVLNVLGVPKRVLMDGATPKV